MSELRFGFCVPLFANPGPAFFRTPAWTALEPGAAVDAAVEAERLGYDSIWVADHLMHGFDDAILEGWTTLAVIAGRTRHIRLGTIHLAQPFRAPAIAAKMAATLDALSGGRLILFYDCGWQEAEVRAYGLDWPSEAERIARMEDGLDLIKALWAAEEPIDFRGRYYSTEGAMCRPGPLQRPRPPIWLGEARHDGWLDAIARHADGWNSTPASPDRLRQKLDAVRAACERARPEHCRPGVVARDPGPGRPDRRRGEAYGPRHRQVASLKARRCPPGHCRGSRGGRWPALERNHR